MCVWNSPMPPPTAFSLFASEATATRPIRPSAIMKKITKYSAYTRFATRNRILFYFRQPISPRKALYTVGCFFFVVFFYYFHPKGLSPQTPPLSPARRNVCGSNIPPVRFFFPSLRETCPNVLGSKVLPPGVLAHWHHPLLLLPRRWLDAQCCQKSFFACACFFSGRSTDGLVSLNEKLGRW